MLRFKKQKPFSTSPVADEKGFVISSVGFGFGFGFDLGRSHRRSFSRVLDFNRRRGA
jgi:hypothetical protein